MNVAFPKYPRKKEAYNKWHSTLISQSRPNCSHLRLCRIFHLSINTKVRAHFSTMAITSICFSPENVYKHVPKAEEFINAPYRLQLKQLPLSKRIITHHLLEAITTLSEPTRACEKLNASFSLEGHTRFLSTPKRYQYSAPLLEQRPKEGR